MFLVKSRCFSHSYSIQNTQQNATIQTFVKFSQSPVAPAAGENSRIQRTLDITHQGASAVRCHWKWFSAGSKPTQTWALQNSSENFAVVSYEKNVLKSLCQHMSQFYLLNQEYFQWNHSQYKSGHSKHFSFFLKLKTFVKLAICILIPKSWWK